MLRSVVVASLSVSVQKERVEAGESVGPRGVPLPVAPGGDDERSVVRGVHAHAVACGLREARLFGFAGGARVGEAEAVHAATGALAVAVGLLWAPAGLVLAAVLVLSAAVRALGGEGLGALVPRRPSWSVLLTVPRTTTRLVLVAALDRARPDLGLRRVVLGLLAAALVATGVELLPMSLAVAAALLVTAGVALSWGRFTARAGAPEAAACAALVDLAVQRQRAGVDDVALVVTGSGATDGAGVDRVLDWYGVAPTGCVVAWVTGAPGPRSGRVSPGRFWAGGALAQWGWARSLLARGYTVERFGGDPGDEATSAAELVRALGAAVWGAERAPGERSSG